MKQREASTKHQSIAGRVYQHVPILETWTKRRILGGLEAEGLCIDADKLSECLEALIADEMIIERSPGLFTRIDASTLTHIQVPSLKEKSAIQKVEQNPVEIPQEIGPVEVLDALADEARLIATSLNGFADKVEAAALNIQGSFDSAGEDSKRLHEILELIR